MVSKLGGLAMTCPTIDRSSNVLASSKRVCTTLPTTSVRLAGEVSITSPDSPQAQEVLKPTTVTIKRVVMFSRPKPSSSASVNIEILASPALPTQPKCNAAAAQTSMHENKQESSLSLTHSSTPCRQHPAGLHCIVQSLRPSRPRSASRLDSSSSRSFCACCRLRSRLLRPAAATMQGSSQDMSTLQATCNAK